MSYGAGSYLMGPKSSQASSSHQSTGAQFLYPPPSNSFPAASSNGRLPTPASPVLPKNNGVRPETMFPPPKRSTHATATVTSRQIKTEVQSTLQQSHKPTNSLGHHMSRNGTHTVENTTQQTIKSENFIKYPMPAEKQSSNHQKSNSKYESSRANPSKTVSWTGNTAGDFVNRSTVNDSRYIKTEVKSEMSSPSSYHMQPNFQNPLLSVLKQSPPPPPPPLPLSLPPPPPPPPLYHPPLPPNKPSSIFSPDKMTPPPPPIETPPRDIKTSISPMLLSPLSSQKNGRSRTHSSSSEPELIPVMPKLEDISGFESIAKGKTAIKLTGKVSEPVLHSKEKKKDNGEKESKPIPPISPVYVPDKKHVTEVPSQPPLEVPDDVGSSKREHKKKKKHKEHREHKDREKEKDKKKDKHKDKYKEKERNKDKPREDPAPIKITIPKDKIHKISFIQDKISQSSTSQSEPNACLKIKIPKDKLKHSHIAHVEQPKPTSLKIKISKDALSMTSSHSTSSSKGSSTSGSSRKRERSSYKDNEEDRHSSSKHAKLAKINGDHRST